MTGGDADPTWLRDGSEIRVRPIRPDDRALLRSAFNQLSKHARYMRFQSPLAELSDKQLSYLTAVDHHDHEALLAIDLDTEEIVGVARFVRINDGVAECAIAVADAWQGRGVATTLLDRLVERAREEGIDHFTALLLAENTEALRLLARLGEANERRAGSQVELEIALPKTQEPSPQLRLVLTAAARGLVVPAVSMWRQVADFAYRRSDPPPEPANVIVAHAYAAGGEAPALTAAAALAGAQRAHVHLVETYWPVLSDRDEADKKLATATDDLRRRGLQATGHLVAGDTADAIIDVAEETRAGLIVIDPRAVSPLTPWRAYSLPARVCARAPCDVLIAR